MPFAKRSGSPSQIDGKLRSRRQEIIEEERIRTLRDSLLLFYDKLIEKYQLIHPVDDQNIENIEVVTREDIEKLASEYAKTKPLGF